MAFLHDPKIENTIDRIAGSILSGKTLNPPNNLKCPCSICNKNCLDNQAAIQCDKCDKWCHISCDGTSLKDYHFYQTTNDNPDSNGIVSTALLEITMLISLLPSAIDLNLLI